MATFKIKSFIKHDDYMTPKYAWDNIKHLIPKNKIIWEAFYGDGNSGKYLEELGFKVIHKPVDFFKNNLGEIIISNPPFSLKQKVLKRLKILDKPFIILCPSSMINTQYIRDLFMNKLQIIIPKKRINFLKKINGEIPKNWGNRCNFDTFYYCYKMNLEKDINWLK